VEITEEASWGRSDGDEAASERSAPQTAPADDRSGHAPVQREQRETPQAQTEQTRIDEVPPADAGTRGAPEGTPNGR
jgi:hypothetical protein